MNDAVVTTALSKAYGRETALDRIDLRVPDGAVYVLVGANGAGKSTAVKVLMNLVRADTGRAEIFGLDTVERGPEARAQVGYVPEGHDQGYRWMTCRRLLQHVSQYYPAWDFAYADHLARTFGLRLDRKVTTLSKGESRRLQLVSALAHRPPLLLLDEPTDGLDPVMRVRALSLLAEHLADTPTTVLMSTHQIHEVESLADHIGALRNGRLVAQMSLDDLQRTVRRYQFEVPAMWQAPRDLQVAGARRGGAGPEMQWTVVGEERVVIDRLAAAGARVRDVRALTLEDVARFGPSLFWTFPVDRRWHALSRVLAGWVVLIAIVAVFVVLQLALTLFTGGDLLADETFRVLLSLSTSTRGALDVPMQRVRWTPTPLFWLVPFTAATGTYVMSSALALGLRDPLRWILSVVLGLLVVFAIGDVVNAEWLSGGLVSVLQTILAGPYGLDALLTARTESLKNEVLLAGGDVAVIWSGLPDVGEWAVATLLWTSAGLVALAAAVSRHRESR